MASICTLASSSAGNAALFSLEGTHLLIDMGLSCRRICRELARLGLTPRDLTAVLITHAHADHVSGLATYIKKYDTPLLCTPGTARQLAERLADAAPLLRPVPPGEAVELGPAALTFLPTSHDCPGSAAVHLAWSAGRVGVLTDTGYIPEETGRALLGADLLVLESNHDPDLLLAGPYPYALKRRVLGPAGHLSNAAAARYAAASALAGTRTVLLAHLSRENNDPRLALETAGAALAAAGCTCRVDVAPRDEPSPVYSLAQEVPSCGE